MFTKDEIVNLLKSARSGRQTVEKTPASEQAAPFDFHAAAVISLAQMEKLSAVHASMATDLVASLSTMVGSECKVVLSKAEQTTFEKLRETLTGGTSFEALRTEVPSATVLLHTDYQTALPMIDLMLGGSGKAPEPLRPLTGVERELFKPAVEAFAGQLQSLWSSFFKASVLADVCPTSSDFLPAQEKVLTLTFDFELGEQRGAWILVVPSILSNALVRRIEFQAAAPASDRSGQAERHLRERLLDSCFRLELSLPTSAISVRKLAHLNPGEIVVLKQRSDEPIQVDVEGVRLFHAFPVACGEKRGAQIHEVLSIPESTEKEWE